jgi:hypothetical protein
MWASVIPFLKLIWPKSIYSLSEWFMAVCLHPSSTRPLFGRFTFAPAASGKLIARGRQIKLGKTLGYADAEVTDETGKVLAHGSSTVIILSGKAIEADPPLPPKFID